MVAWGAEQALGSSLGSRPPAASTRGNLRPRLSTLLQAPCLAFSLLIFPFSLVRAGGFSINNSTPGQVVMTAMTEEWVAVQWGIVLCDDLIVYQIHCFTCSSDERHDISFKNRERR